jgi:hypothetical protein
MKRRRPLILSGLLLASLTPTLAQACSLCASMQKAPTIREEASQTTARLILLGTAQNARYTGGATGITDFHISAVLRSDPYLGKKKMIELPRYLAGNDPKNPPKFLIFCDIYMDKLDPFRGIPVKSDDVAEYVRKALALDPKKSTEKLEFYFHYLEHADKEIARDAFLEFAKASDQEIGQVAPRLAANKLRAWLENPATPAERLNVYALLLGACGNNEDARFLRSLLDQTSERITNAYDGILGGFMHLRPQEGWDIALSLLRDNKKSLPVRLAVVRTLRYYHGSQPNESRANVLKGLETMLLQGDLADLAVEDLRRWQIWDLTPEVLSLYGKKGYDAPLMQRAIIRYALSCKQDNATRAFVADRRKEDPELVKEVEESLRLENGK